MGRASVGTGGNPHADDTGGSTGYGTDQECHSGSPVQPHVRFDDTQHHEKEHDDCQETTYPGIFTFQKSGRAFLNLFG